MVLELNSIYFKTLKQDTLENTNGGVMDIFFLLILGALIVISPGADFALILNETTSNGRKAGILISLGISMGVLVHVTYSLLGLGVVVSKNGLIFTIVKYLGATYLFYIGALSLYSSRKSSTYIGAPKKTSPISLVKKGFICNMFNPKTMIFFLSLFSQVMSMNVNKFFPLLYGIYLSLMHFLWFFCVAILLTSISKSYIDKYANIIKFVSGMALCVFGVKLLL